MKSIKSKSKEQEIKEQVLDENFEEIKETGDNEIIEEKVSGFEEGNEKNIGKPIKDETQESVNKESISKDLGNVNVEDGIINENKKAYTESSDAVVREERTK